MGKRPPPPTTRPAWFEFAWSVLAAAAKERLGDAVGDIEAQPVDAARDALVTSLDGDGSFAAIVANAQLGPADIEVLALAVAVEADPAAAALLAGEAAGPRPRLTLGHLPQLLGADHLGPLTVSPDAPLRCAGFLDVGRGVAWHEQPIDVDASLVWALLGDRSTDPDLPTPVTSFDADPQAGWYAHVAAHVPEGLVGSSAVVVVNGPDPVRRRQFGSLVALGSRFLCVAPPSDDRGWAAVVREATITGRGLILEHEGTLRPDTRRWVERSRHLVWVLSGPSGPNDDALPDRAWIGVEVPDIEVADQEWIDAFGPDTPRTHRLTAQQLERVRRTAPSVLGDVSAAVRRLAGGQLDTLTQRIRPSRTWNDLVLRPNRRDALWSIVNRYRYSATVYDEWGFAAAPSRGLVALFSGPSGTGKTLSAEVIAHELGLDMFKLELSAIVSKYIGETEKNLEQVFDAAATANVVLFFDEADALFGKRSEVRDARDRYANIEVSYLLQRIEAYNGVVIMATNFEKNVDDAFLRRIHVRVGFELPSVDERRKIWTANLPESAPVIDIDVDWLAERFEMSGGSIRNAAVHAAFVAASEAMSSRSASMTMKHAVIGVAHEFRKSGRLVRSTDFGEHFDVISELPDGDTDPDTAG